ncbi:cupin domain-containing protein [Mycobacterium sp. 852002-51057_SCH5723018]|uniref:cupin domain-containing protein n=1 Tax=Mycobacterium sp. 852002-51057_SCH5723018 TaxID=1834094 RepID=UPI0007FB96C9|nr:cupin domain-containing protein [Mycobacterium sp. 852002-51057_SCH5723018]OBG29922.1 cupin [Mycobacterium sp. 852002-51057_SCH5723018]
MPSAQGPSGLFARLAETTGSEILEVFGPTFEFLTNADEDGDVCVMRAVVPPGVAVPLHSHDDYEGFFILSGTQQVLLQDAQGPTWVDVCAGDYVQIPGGMPHAHRNVAAEPAVDLIVTTARLGQFFREVGRPVADAVNPPSAQELARFVEIAARYGYWLGSPEENAAVGIDLPVFAG